MPEQAPGFEPAPRGVDVEEEVQSQRELLKSMRAEHRRQLEDRGILDKIRGRFPLAQIDQGEIRLEATPYASEGYGDNSDDEMLEGSRRLSVLCLEPAEEGKFAFELTVPVAYVKDDALKVAEGFAVEDAELVKRLTEGLEEARSLGVLPNLTPNLGIGNRPPAST